MGVFTGFARVRRVKGTNKQKFPKNIAFNSPSEDILSALKQPTLRTAAAASSSVDRIPQQKAARRLAHVNDHNSIDHCDQPQQRSFQPISREQHPKPPCSLPTSSIIYNPTMPKAAYRNLKPTARSPTRKIQSTVSDTRNRQAKSVFHPRREAEQNTDLSLFDYCELAQYQSKTSERVDLNLSVQVETSLDDGRYRYICESSGSERQLLKLDHASLGAIGKSSTGMQSNEQVPKSKKDCVGPPKGEDDSYAQPFDRGSSLAPLPHTNISNDLTIHSPSPPQFHNASKLINAAAIASADKDISVTAGGDFNRYDLNFGSRSISCGPPKTIQDGLPTRHNYERQEREELLRVLRSQAKRLKRLSFRQRRVNREIELLETETIAADTEADAATRVDPLSMKTSISSDPLLPDKQNALAEYQSLIEQMEKQIFACEAKSRIISNRIILSRSGAYHQTELETEQLHRAAEAEAEVNDENLTEIAAIDREIETLTEGIHNRKTQYNELSRYATDLDKTERMNALRSQHQPGSVVLGRYVRHRRRSSDSFPKQTTSEMEQGDASSSCASRIRVVSDMDSPSFVDRYNPWNDLRRGLPPKPVYLRIKLQEVKASKAKGELWSQLSTARPLPVVIPLLGSPSEQPRQTGRSSGEADDLFSVDVFSLSSEPDALSITKAQSAGRQDIVDIDFCHCETTTQESDRRISESQQLSQEIPSSILSQSSSPSSDDFIMNALSSPDSALHERTSNSDSAIATPPPPPKVPQRRHTMVTSVAVRADRDRHTFRTDNNSDTGLSSLYSDDGSPTNAADPHLETLV